VSYCPVFNLTEQPLTILQWVFIKETAQKQRAAWTSWWT